MTALGPAYASSPLSLREQSRRRLILLAIGSLLVLGTSPVFGHHLPIDTDKLLAGVDHIGALCVTALHLLFAPVHYIFHVVIGAGLLYAAWDRTQAWRRVREALGPIEAWLPSPGHPFWKASVAAGLEPQRLRIVAGLPSPAFTLGLLSPRVFAAEALADRLTADELVAVLAHEQAHVERRDPLRLSLLRALACTLFWIPALRRLADDMSDEAEILADDAAAAGRPLVLASAIHALAQWPEATRRPSAGVGFDQPDVLDRRIRRLLGEETPVRSRVTGRSLLGAATALALVWTSGILMAHPLPAASAVMHERHCDHRNEWALAHLFCLGSPFAAPAPQCPHQHDG